MTDGHPVRVDPHVKVIDEAVVERAKARGLDALVYAPHFTRLPEIEATARRLSDDELTVLPAREVFTGRWRARKHVLALGLDSPVPDFIGLEAAFEEFARQEAVVLVPHPAFLTVSLDLADVERFRDAIHGVETYNPKHWIVHNQRAQTIARITGLPAFGSSYAHLPGTVGEVWTAFEGIEPSEAGVLEALRSGAPRSVVHRDGAAHRLRRTLEFSHLFYENSVTKFDRVVLSGTEATHPSQPPYGGRFTVAGGE
ncbi:MAG: PHP-associated domain-containing protein [Halobacteriales archaeon]|nr:PHP-associated domain-containing protein [Halobacteriales archaeon]